jgi:hypothetical protein
VSKFLKPGINPGAQQEKYAPDDRNCRAGSDWIKRVGTDGLETVRNLKQRDSGIAG